MLGVFSYIGYYLYMEYIKKKDKIKGADDVANLKGAAKKNVLIRLFYTDWCPHCQSAMPEWNNFKSKYDNQLANDYLLTIKEVDCSDEDSVRQLLNENNDIMKRVGYCKTTAITHYQSITNIFCKLEWF